MTIPKPLVMLNQWFLIISISISSFTNSLLLLVPLTIGVITLILRKNPLITLGKLFLKRPLSSYQQEDTDQQYFNQIIATVCLSLSYLAYHLGWNFAGLIFSILVILSASIALMGFCIGCFIRFQYQQWLYRRQSNI